MTARVLVVDDSPVVRRLVTRLLERADGIQVAGTAPDGQAALEAVDRLRPDLVTMDVEMPGMDGITAVRELRRAGHGMPVVMLSTLTERGARATLDALAAGATDYVAKPSGTGSLQRSVDVLAAELLPRIHALTARRRPPVGTPAAAAPVRDTGPVEMVLVGSSTGGPAALTTFVGSLSGPLPVPVLVTQHMPPLFTRQLAARLERVGASTVVEAGDGVPLAPGQVYVAPGGRHLEVVGSRGAWRTRLSDAPAVHFCRPSVDVMLDSAARAVGARHLLVVVLTGMGADGARGAARIARGGGRVIVQDEATSVVWGMPGATVEAGAAHAVLPLDRLGPAVERAVRGAG